MPIISSSFQRFLTLFVIVCIVLGLVFLFVLWGDQEPGVTQEVQIESVPLTVPVVSSVQPQVGASGEKEQGTTFSTQEELAPVITSKSDLDGAASDLDSVDLDYIDTVLQENDKDASQL